MVSIKLFLARTLLLLYTVGNGGLSALDWHRQYLGHPFNGQHSGIAIYDLNGDGYDDILFSAGRHSVDQSFAFITLGFDHDTRNFRFSIPLPLGYPGGFNNVDVAHLSSLPPGHVAVMLAGGACTDTAACKRDVLEPAVLLDVFVTGCSVDDPDGRCIIDSTRVAWREGVASGNRNGALSAILTGGPDSAIVLVGKAGLTVYHPYNGEYRGTPDYKLSTEDKLPHVDDAIDRGSGLAVGYVGKRKAIVVGPRSEKGPAPIIVVYQNRDGSYEHWQIQGPKFEFYSGDQRIAVQTTGVELADLNGDGNHDIVKAQYLPEKFIVRKHPIDQSYILVDDDPRNDVPLKPSTIWKSMNTGRTVTTGQIYKDSDLPDVVLGMASGEVLLFANLGVKRIGLRSVFLGFEFRESLVAGPSGCHIRDIKVASLFNCTTSIICAVTCGATQAEVGNFMFTKQDRASCTPPPPTPYRQRLRTDRLFQRSRSTRTHRRRGRPIH